jgi:hypothetical protein
MMPLHAHPAHGLLASALLAALSGCGGGNSDDGAAPTLKHPVDAIVIERAHDVGNAGDGSDVRLTLTIDPQVQADLADLRVLVSTTPLTLEQAVGAADYGSPVTLSAAGQVAVKLPGTARDTAGAPLANGVPYQVYALAQFGGEERYLSATKQITLLDQPIFAGSYSGVWNDAIVKDFRVTMRLGADYRGEIFYSPNFKPCCPPGTSNDGTVQVAIDGATISSFVVQQYLGSYKGGHCKATYTGRGEVTDEVTLSILELSGSDCDGTHTPGTIQFTRL